MSKGFFAISFDPKMDGFKCFNFLYFRVQINNPTKNGPIVGNILK